MKITLERLREIVTEEVIKESVSPEDAQRTIVALLQGTPPNVTGDIMGAVYDEMYDADVSEPSPESEEEDFPTEYQAGGAYGDRPRMGFLDNINEIIQQEYYIYLIEREHGLLTEADFTRPDAERAGITASSNILSPRQISPVDKFPGFNDVLADPASTTTDRLAATGAKERYEYLTRLVAKSVKQIADIDVFWQKFLNYGGRLSHVLQIAEPKMSAKELVDALETLWRRVRNVEAHERAEEDPQSRRDAQGRPITRHSLSQS